MPEGRRLFTEGQVNTYLFRAHKTQSLSQANITRYQFLSASNEPISSSYYNFSRINFYLSGSDIAQTNPLFNSYPTVGNRLDGQNIYLNKFYETGSVGFISQSLFGDEIKKGSFILTDNYTAKEIKIVDDSNGNLYSTNAVDSRSVVDSADNETWAGNNPSSSKNYVGNIFYDTGVFTITETGSWSGSSDDTNPGGVINYSEVTTGNYDVQFQGSLDIKTYEYVCRIEPNDFNNTQNMTIFKENGGRGPFIHPVTSESVYLPIHGQGSLKDNLTSSYWPNYITEVGLYDDNNELMAHARLSQPIPKSTQIPMRFFVRMDY